MRRPVQQVADEPRQRERQLLGDPDEVDLPVRSGDGVVGVGDRAVKPEGLGGEMAVEVVATARQRRRAEGAFVEALESCPKPPQVARETAAHGEQIVSQGRRLTGLVMGMRDQHRFGVLRGLRQQDLLAGDDALG